MHTILPIQKLYIQLKHAYSSQYWWPVTDKRKNAPEYKPRKKLTARQKLEICLGAILTQNTSWKNVEKAIVQLNENNLISIQKLTKINSKKLANLIRSSGYFNQKSKKLKAFAKYVDENHNSNLNSLLKKPLPELRTELLSLHGIGPETADSIILYAAQKPSFVIDTYTKRIFARVYGKEINEYEKLKEIFERELPANVTLFKEFHALLVEHAKRYCKTKPGCFDCPIRSACYFGTRVHK